MWQRNDHWAGTQIDDAFVMLDVAILLEKLSRPLLKIDHFLALQCTLFRPKWQNALPKAADNRVMSRDLCENANFVSLPKIGNSEEVAIGARAEALSEMIFRVRTLIGETHRDSRR